MGWPPGRAKLSDCTVIRRCSDERHAADVDRWRKRADRAGQGDNRAATVLRLYGGANG